MYTVKLHYKKLGHKKAIIILHGLFGSLDNWQTVANALQDEFTIYLVDLRNHGKSPHTNRMTYELMASDIIEFMDDHMLHSIGIVGHSMGGKVLLELIKHEDPRIDKYLIFDIAPKKYLHTHDDIILALNQLDLNLIQKRLEADTQLAHYIRDMGVRQFLLKNLDRLPDGGFRWKFNLKILTEQYFNICESIVFSKIYEVDVKFVKGEYSNYITDEDQVEILKNLPKAKFEEVKAAGHWVHADKVNETIQLISKYFKELNE